MKLRDFLERWGLSGLKIKLGFLEGEFKPSDPDRNAAWDLYVELLTRITTQYLPPESGDEKAALARRCAAEKRRILVSSMIATARQASPR